MSDRTDSLRLGAVLAVAILAGALVYFLLIRGGDEDGGAEAMKLPKGAEPVAVSEDELASLSESVGHDVYWAGPQEDATLEVTRTEPGNVFIRYLPEGAEAGDPKPDFLTVGTYPVEDAVGALERASQAEGAVTEETEDGALVVTNESDPTSVHLAYPESDLQIEVYAPDPDLALEVATSGAIQPAS